MEANMRPRVLLIEDEEVLSAAIKLALKDHNIEVTCAKSPKIAIEKYKDAKMNFDLLLIDYNYEGSNVTGADLALKIRQLNPYQTIIFMTGYHDTSFLDSMLQTGVAKTFIRKDPSSPDFLKPAIEALTEIVKNKWQEDSYEDELKRTSDINSLGVAGRSREYHDVVKTVMQVRQFQSRFLLIGETGSGKELIAKAFKINGKPFFPVNCASYDKNGDQLMEAQLFGRVKGAYTGADTNQPGVLELGEGGVIFLDELHHLSLGAQAKLLRAIDDNKFRRLGDMSGPERTLNATIVAATKPIIFEMIKKGLFMEDLYFRLRKTEINIPSLRDRPSDIKPLAEFLTRRIADRLKISIDLSPQVIRDFEAYTWPGNVRELECFIEETAMSSPTHEITPDSFKKYLAKKAMVDKFNELNSPKVNLEQTVEAIEADEIIRVLSESATVTEAADILGMKRSTLNDKMRKLKIKAKRYFKINLNLEGSFQSSPI